MRWQRPLIPSTAMYAASSGLSGKFRLVCWSFGVGCSSSVPSAIPFLKLRTLSPSPLGQRWQAATTEEHEDDEEQDKHFLHTKSY
jgi:hypothetical protein